MIQNRTGARPEGARSVLRSGAFWWLGILLLLPSACGRQDVPDAAPAPDAARQVQAELLRGELAGGGQYYYELRLAEKRIHLCHSGISIRHYAFSDPRLGSSRLANLSRQRDEPWLYRVWRGTFLEPANSLQRKQIIPGDERTRPTPGAAGVIPPTMEELIPVPDDFRIQCPEGLAILVHLNGPIPYTFVEESPWAKRWRNFQEAFQWEGPDQIRLRLEMDGATGAAFFRSYAEKPDLLIIL